MIVYFMIVYFKIVVWRFQDLSGRREEMINMMKINEEWHSCQMFSSAQSLSDIQMTSLACKCQ
uniref:Uncharacterized protein n=1 Tax=Arion vulgaris TaxID=1028688 RepID=A0A0B6Y7X6_9EUPU